MVFDKKFFFTGIGIRASLKRKFDEADVHIVDQDRIIDTMDIQMVSGKG